MYRGLRCVHAAPPVAVVAGHEERHAEGAHAAALRELLHHRRRLAHRLPGPHATSPSHILQCTTLNFSV